MANLRRFLRYVRPYTASLLAAVALLLVTGALASLGVAAMNPLVNEVLLPGVGAAAVQASPLSGWAAEVLPREFVEVWQKQPYVFVPLVLSLAFGLRGIFLFLGGYLLRATGARVVRDLRADLFDSIVGQSLLFFEHHRSADLLSRMLTDVQKIQRVVSADLAAALRTGTMVPFMVAVIVVHDWRLSAIVLAVLGVLGLPMVRLSQRLRRVSRRAQEATADVGHRASEAIGAVRVVQAFGMEGHERRRFGDVLAGLLHVDLHASRAAALAPAMIEISWAISGGLIFFFAGRAISGGTLDPGNFAVVLAGLGMLFAAVRVLNRCNLQLQIALASADRVFEILDEPVVLSDAADASQVGALDNEIRFEGVSFSYGEQPALDRVDLVVNKGEVLALVGSSGAGKSTLLSLVPRFFDPGAGRVTLDGRDLRQLRLADLRALVGLVTQETLLFDGPVHENIAYGQAVDRAAVEKAARAASAHDFIVDLPGGYDAVLGEGGSGLSAGQRQRLTIARALLKDPPILLLDEPTSALDAESEAAVQAALDELMRGRTCIVIAHRLATVQRADRIAVLEKGRVVEIGSHGELTRRRGRYARLRDLQILDAPGPAAPEALPNRAAES
ncbi:MAG: ABC transporter ATP-binding protein [Acidobacteriota bacterium]|nr:ABC transporter ATP-binding protein [Acidobacteriota bacterium]